MNVVAKISPANTTNTESLGTIRINRIEYPWVAELNQAGWAVTLSVDTPLTQAQKDIVSERIESMIDELFTRSIDVG